MSTVLCISSAPGWSCQCPAHRDSCAVSVTDVIPLSGFCLICQRYHSNDIRWHVHRPYIVRRYQLDIGLMRSRQHYHDKQCHSNKFCARPVGDLRSRPTRYLYLYILRSKCWQFGACCPPCHAVCSRPPNVTIASGLKTPGYECAAAGTGRDSQPGCGRADQAIAPPLQT